MKAIYYWLSIGVLFLLEAAALCVALGLIGGGLVLAGSIHFIVAFLFAVLIGIHRKAVSIALLSVPVIAANPVIGLIAMVVIDEKFNRETQKRFLEAWANFRSGNPFGSPESGVEVADNSGITVDKYNNLIRRMTDRRSQAKMREVEVVATARKFDALPLLERIATTTTHDGRALAQAAIQETSERVSVWAGNLRNLVERGETDSRRAGSPRRSGICRYQKERPKSASLWIAR